MDNDKKILIVDDNSINRAILKKILGDSYLLLEAENGIDALNIMTQNKESVAAVLLDLVMPEMDGYEFLRIMKTTAGISDIPVIVTTQSEDSDTEIRALELGAIDFILKPYEPSIIKQRIINIMNLRETAALRNTVERDLLTGVYNRETFYKKVAEFIDRNVHSNYKIICFDIERFKIINDLYGTNRGDKLLAFVANNLRAYTGEYDCVYGRLTADNFAVCAKEDDIDINDFANHLQEQLNQYPLNLDINIKFGVYIVDDTLLPVSIMCDRANLAIKKIKGKYEKKYSFYDTELRDKIIEEQEITSEMTYALTSRQFVAYYQPKYDLSTETVIGAEALVRWVHPKKGVISPAEFMPLFEKNGFVTQVDICIWEQACQLIRNIIDTTGKELSISVNVSRVDIYNTNLVNILCTLTDKYKIPNRLLEIEITETAYTENAAQLISVINELKSHGFVIEMDDFGSGYSSLNMLNDVPVDMIKLDMKFLQDNRHNTNIKNGNILNFIIGLARWMDIPVVAEGIETQEQSAYLRAMGCSRGQGYYFSKPLEKSDFIKLLGERDVSQPKKIAQSNCNILNYADIFDATSSFNLLFNSFANAIVLYEYFDKKLEFIRGNDNYYQIAGVSQADSYKISANMMDYICDEDREYFYSCLDSLKQMGDEVTVNAKWKKVISDEILYLRRHIKVVNITDEHKLLISSIEDITKQQINAKKIERQHDFYQRLYDTVNCGIAQLDIYDTRFIYVNNAVCKMLGYTKEEFNKQPRYWQSFVEKKYVDEIVDTLTNKDVSPDVTLNFEYPMIKKDGQRIWVRDVTQKVMGESGEYVYQSVLTDDTERKKREDALRIIEEQYRIVAQTSNNRVFRYDAATQTAVYPTKDSASPAEVMVKNVPESLISIGYVDKNSIDDYREFFNKIKRGDKQGNGQFKLRRKNGNMGWFNADFYTQFTLDNKQTSTMCIFSDITALKEKELALYDITRKDSYTGLLNKHTFNELADKWVTERKPDQNIALLIVDIDEFKVTNDNFGHVIGDKALLSMAQVLISFFCDDSLVARVGGDEFAVLLKDDNGIQNISETADKICVMFADKVKDLGVTCSVGYAIAPMHTDKFNKLYVKADKALYMAKNKGKNTSCMYERI